jgi:MFS family permease
LGSLRDIILDKQLILLGVGTLGFGFAYTDISGFMPLYENSALGVPAVLGGLVASLLTVIPIFTALWGGRLFERASRHRMITVASLAGSAGALVLGAYPSVLAAALCAGVGGVFSGVGYTFAFAGARDLNRAGKEYDSLAVAWVNSISLTGSFFPPILFSYVVENFGYQNAWLWSGGLTLLFVIPILLMVERWGR